MEQLHKYQDGYSHRDTDRLDSFMEQLFSRENSLVIGTMSKEIYIGQEEIEDLIFADWNAWGDRAFLMDNAHISTSGNVAWISTIGYVKFDMPQFLVLPLRLSAVMVQEDLTRKFQYMQFQFDLNFITLFLTTILLAIWISVSLVSLVVVSVRSLIKRTSKADKSGQR